MNCLLINGEVRNYHYQDFVTTQYYGFSIRGQVLKKGINIPCRVHLFLRSTGEKVRDILTDKQGFYSFDNLAMNRYYLVAHDPDGEYNAVIQDNVIPK